MAHLGNTFARRVRHSLQAMAAFVFYWFFKLLPFDAGSGLGGWLARTIGPRLHVSERATRNLSRAFPEKSADEISSIVRRMWDNLGRVAAEYPHLDQMDVYGGGNRIEVVGAEHIDQLRDDGKPGIFMTAHLGNWEFSGLATSQKGLPVDRVYRQANNRMTEWLYRRGRAAVEGQLIPKGAAGARQLLKSLADGNHLGMLVDQKMNDGIAVPFFGRDAMTAPALAQLALKFDCPVVPARVERLEGARFRIIFLPPFEFEPSGDRLRDVRDFMTMVNAQLESWIRDTPDQWLWLHNRWPD